MTPSRERGIVHYGVAVLTSGTAFLVRLAVTGYVGPGLPPYLFFYPAVLLTAMLGGVGPGLLATALSALLAAYFILPPEGFAVGSAVDLLGLGIFSVMGVGISGVAELYHRARLRAATYATELAVQTAEARAATAAAQALQASEERFRLLFEGATDAILVTDPIGAGRVLAVNPAACRLFGYTDAEFLGLTHEALLDPTDGQVATMLHARERHGRALAELAYKRKDGTGFTGELTSACIDPTGGHRRAVAIIRDISARKQAEAALHDAHTQLARRVAERTEALTQALSTQTAQAAQLRTVTGELALAEQRERRRLADVLHDGLQQQLVAARLRAYMLARSPDAEVQAGAQEVVALLEEAIAQTRSLSGELNPPVLQTGHLRPALEWLAGWMWEKHQLTVHVGPAALVLPPLAPDVAVLLYQAVRELLLNVVKYAQVSAAAVTLIPVDGTLRCTVADAGVGFEPTRLRVGGGTAGGVGLLGIRERLELLGGRLDIASAPGQGSRFTLTVPLPPAA